MPMYMDIHEVRGATVADVAKAHIADVKTQGRYGVEYHKYWPHVPGPRRSFAQGLRPAGAGACGPIASAAILPVAQTGSKRSGCNLH